MAEIKITVDKAEQIAVLTAIQELNNTSHIRYMSRDMIACTANIKESKVRVILQSLVDAKLAIQYEATDNPRRQRYYFVLTDEGKAILKNGAINNGNSSKE